MTSTFRITPRALQGLQNIGRYTLKKWGREQRNKYLRALEQRFKWLADNPHMGSHRPEIQEGYFSYLQGSHLIFYLQGEGGIVIIGLPHRCMDVGGYFS